ncbi:MAG: GH25 family lysozyme [Sporolactobacillus sp.]
MEQRVKRWIPCLLIGLIWVLMLAGPPAGTAHASSSYSAYVTTYTLKIRSRASTHYRTLRTLAMTNKVSVIGRSGKYSRVRYGSTTGYVQAQYLNRSKFQSQTGYVTSYTLKMRSQASIHYTTRRTLAMANKVTVIGKGNKYALIQYGGTTGYVRNACLNRSAFHSYTAYVTSPTLKIRTQASTHYKVRRTLSRNQSVTVLGKGNKYALVRSSSTSGYVQNRYLTTTKPVSYDRTPSDPPTTASSQFGIDISHYQNTVDFNAIKQDGNSFIITKATDGTSAPDAYFERNSVGASHAGLTVDAYHFLRANSPEAARNEANHFATTVKNVAAKDGVHFQYLFVDVEINNAGGKAALTNSVLAFLDQMRANGLNQLGIYSDMSFFNTDLNLPQITQAQPAQPKFLIWVARYRGQETYLGPGFSADIWQYTSSGHASGVVGAVDKDISYYVTNGM